MRYNFKVQEEGGRLPTRHTRSSAGVDFYAAHDAGIEPGKSAIISTGVSWNPQWFPVELQETDSGYSTSVTIALIIQSRSGYAFKKGIEASNAGVIDADYTPHGEEKAIIHVKLYNNSDEKFYVRSGDKICQGIPQLIPFFEDVETLDESREGKGFGSSDDKG